MDDLVPFLDKPTISEAESRIKSIIGADFDMKELIPRFYSDYCNAHIYKDESGVLYQCIANSPNALFAVLGIAFQNNPEQRQTISVLLHHLITKGKGYMWSYLEYPTQAFIKNLLLTHLNDKDTDSVLSTSLVYTIVEFAEVLLPKDKWPDFYMFINSVNSTKIQSRVSSLIFWIVNKHSTTTMKCLTVFHSFILKTLSSSKLDVKLGCLSTFLFLLESVSVEKYPQAKDLVPIILGTLREAIGCKFAHRQVVDLLRRLVYFGPNFLGIGVFDEVRDAYQSQYLILRKDDEIAEYLFSNDLSSFEDLITKLNSSNDMVRSAALEAYFELRNNQLKAFTDRLLVVLNESANDMVRMSVAALLQDHLDVVCNFYSEQEKGKFRSLLWSSFENEKHGSVKKMTGYVISKMAVQFKYDLLGHIEYILKSIDSVSPKEQFSGFLLLSELVHKDIDHLSPYLPQLHIILCKNLTAPDLDVKFASLVAAIQVMPHMLHFLDSDEIKFWETGLVQLLREGLSVGQVSSVQKILTSLNDLAEFEPSVLNEKFFELVRTVLNVTELHPLDDGTRNQALELLITLVEAGIPEEASLQFYQRLFKILVQGISFVGATSSKSEDFKSILNRLALVIRGEDLVQIASEVLEDCISAEPENRLVAIEVILQIAEGCSMVGMKKMMTVITNYYCDNDPQVQLASMRATLQLQSDLGDKFKSSHKQIIHAIEQAIDHFQTTESKELAQSAMLKFKGGS